MTVVKRQKKRNKPFLELEITRHNEYPDFYKVLKACKDYAIEEQVEKVLPKEITCTIKDFQQKSNDMIDLSIVVALTQQADYKHEKYSISTHQDPCVQLFINPLESTFGTKSKRSRWENDKVEQCSQFKDVYSIASVEQDEILIEVEVNIDKESTCALSHNIAPIISATKNKEVKQNDKVMQDNNWDIDFVTNKLDNEVIRAVEGLCSCRKMSINNVLKALGGKDIGLSRWANTYSFEMIKILTRQCPPLASYEAVSDVMGILSKIQTDIKSDEHQRKAIVELFHYIYKATTPIYGLSLTDINIEELEVINEPRPNEQPM